MIRRAWGSRHAGNVVALLALFAALGGTATGQRIVPNDRDEGQVTAQISQRQVARVLRALEKDGGQLTGKMFKNGSLTSADVKNNALTGRDVRNNALTGSDIKNNALTGIDIRPASLTGNLIAPGTIQGAHIAAQAIGSAQIAAQAITAAQIAQQTITESQIKPNAITSTTINEAELRGVEKCSGGLLGPFGDVCTTPLQAAGSWSEAELACDRQGLRLPTITEGLRALSTFGETQSIWTDEVWGTDGGDPTLPGRFGALRRASPAAGDIYLDGRAHGDAVQFRCVIKSSSST